MIQKIEEIAKADKKDILTESIKYKNKFENKIQEIKKSKLKPAEIQKVHPKTYQKKFESTNIG